MTKGKAGVEPATRQFMASQTRGQLVALIGSESLDAPTGGVLNIEQAHLLRRIDRGDSALVGELFSSLTPEQFSQLRGLLTENQLLVIAQVAEGLEEMKASGAAGVDVVRGDATATLTETAEQRLLARFLEALPEDVNVRLLGDWEQGDGDAPMRNVSPGVLRPDQAALMAKVAMGNLPPSALDDLLPDSASPAAITDEQREKAAAILPPSAAILLAELFATRMSAQQASATTSAT
jgi:hypothetical protein